MVRCAGITKKGINCMRDSGENEEYCWQHRSCFNEVCPICLESDGITFITSCMHNIHTACASGMYDLRCPICRTTVTNWDGATEEKIRDNMRKYEEELNEEERQRLLEESEERNNAFSNLNLRRLTPPQLEVAFALNFMSQYGIPLRLIPETITINTTPHSPRLQTGLLFSTIVTHTLNSLNAYEDDTEGSEYSEDPFEEENEELSSLIRSVRFNRG